MQNAAVALAAVELAGYSRAEAARVLGEFRGATRRLELRGQAGGVDVVDSYAHHPRELAADIAAARDGGRVLALFQPHLYSRTRHLAREFGAALASADVVAVTDVYRAREQPVEGVTGKLVVDALAESRPGMELGWTPAVEDGVRFLARRARTGDRVLTLGAGDVDRAARSAPRGARLKIEARVQLGRYTTLGVGRRSPCVREALEGRRGGGSTGLGTRARARRSSTIGLGSNLLVADEGVDGARPPAGRRACARPRLEASYWSRAAARRTRSACTARAAGLAAFEFACAIPGTVGGGSG